MLVLITCNYGNYTICILYQSDHNDGNYNRTFRSRTTPISPDKQFNESSIPFGKNSIVSHVRVFPQFSLLLSHLNSTIMHKVVNVGIIVWLKF